MPVPTTTSGTSPHKVEFAQKVMKIIGPLLAVTEINSFVQDLHSPGRNARYSGNERQAWLPSSTPNSRVVSLSHDEDYRMMPVITISQEEKPSGLSRPALSTTERINSLGRDAATGRAYGNTSMPTKVASYNPVQNFINPVGHLDGTGFQNVPSEELANGFHGMAINDGYGQSSQTQSLMYHQQPIIIPAPANVPSQPNPLQIPGHHMVTHAPPPMPTYPPFPTPSDYYYSGIVPQPDYNYGYDPYRGIEATSIASPVALNASVPMYAGIPPPHPLVPLAQPDMRHQVPQFYEFNGAYRPPTQFPMAPMTFQPPAPVSPVQLTQAHFAAQMQANNAAHAQVCDAHLTPHIHSLIKKLSQAIWHAAAAPASRLLDGKPSSAAFQEACEARFLAYAKRVDQRAISAIR